MSVSVGTAIGTAGAVAGGVKRLVGGRRRPDNRAAIARLRAARPTGYLTTDDYRARDRSVGRLTEGAQAQGRLASTEVSRRSRARGLAGSPSEERSQARVNDQTALAVQHAGESGEELLYNTQRGREAFQQESELAIFGSETGQATREAARMQAEDAMYWNSLNEFLPRILGYLPPSGATAPITMGPRQRGFNPSPASPGVRRPAPQPF